MTKTNRELIAQLSIDNDYLSEFLDFAATQNIEPEQIGVWIADSEDRIGFLRGIFGSNSDVVKKARTDRTFAINALSNLIDQWEEASNASN